jgi:hypothetical protein
MARRPGLPLYRSDWSVGWSLGLQRPLDRRLHAARGAVDVAALKAELEVDARDFF